MQCCWPPTDTRCSVIFETQYSWFSHFFPLIISAVVFSTPLPSYGNQISFRFLLHPANSIRNYTPYSINEPDSILKGNLYLYWYLYSLLYLVFKSRADRQHTNNCIIKYKDNLSLLSSLTSFSKFVKIAQVSRLKKVQCTTTHIPVDTRRWINVGLTLVQRRRRWTNVKPALIQSLLGSRCVSRC